MRYRTFDIDRNTKCPLDSSCSISNSINNRVLCFLHLPLLSVDEDVRRTERRAPPLLRLLAVNHLTNHTTTTTTTTPTTQQVG